MTEMKSEDPGAMGIQCDLMVPGRLRKAGVLSKLGGVRDGAGGNWRTRWCVLEDDFFWYEDEGALLSGQAPKGRIRLDTWFAMPVDAPNPDNLFVLHAIPRSLKLKANSKEEMREWVDALNFHGRMEPHLRLAFQRACNSHP
uniref:PH domain-containing protein n=1 Tax=Pinguiococcus pyrenoidosus TaxID=172671 RepID=A0A6U0VHQ2_9STRA|mmetsp:Transcript_2543/g.10648  ORF Transcript_2543/g.10648 Transcript_2543/m.10648 type:complete len:142 (+) Transcript_2543:178-603(+)